MSINSHYRGDGFEGDGYESSGFVKRDVVGAAPESMVCTPANYTAPEAVEIENRERAMFQENLPEWLYRLLEGEGRLQ